MRELESGSWKECLAELARILDVQSLLAQAEAGESNLLQLGAQQTRELVGGSGAMVELMENGEHVLAASCGVATAHGARSTITAPLRHQSHVVGRLTVVSEAPEAFDEVDVAAVRLTAAVLGAAVGQARALEEQQQAEDHAWETAEQLGGILRAATELAIVGVDHHGHVTFFNSGAEKMLGYIGAEIIGRDVQLLHDASELTARAAERGVSIAELFVGPAMLGGASTNEWTYVRKDGSHLLVALTVTGMRAEDGTLLGFVGVASDITQRRAVERMKDEFVSVVSHELRTPLTGIRASLGLLSSGAVAPESPHGRRMLEIAVANTDRLVRLLNDILDLERIRIGGASLQKQPTMLGPLLQQSAEVVQSLAADAGVRVDVQPVAVQLSVDSERLIQVLSQLLSNAVKFSKAGAVIRLRGCLVDNVVRMEVQDEGTGIPAEHLERIFLPFHQVDSSDSRARGGTGLGLAICQQIVQQHGGRIWAESVVGTGTTFIVELPRGR